MASTFPFSCVECGKNIEAKSREYENMIKLNPSSGRELSCFHTKIVWNRILIFSEYSSFSTLGQL